MIIIKNNTKITCNNNNNNNNNKSKHAHFRLEMDRFKES